MHIPIKRSKNNKIFAGVVAGISEHFGWNVALARVIWVLLALTPAVPGIIAYLLFWLLMEDPD
ncbi:PspC domain-containing protein [Companilactobacillus mishanensis]|uniref:PspC domain-containing protein n=1 Tax=Companilactobacillus mishanensis TaxID=2486008 RepID=A0A5P0ZG51_9LACO|nr:PspC domain-containing protein [Companilactobacillus mishanensis]MQS52031.1 PspC domain-containing protein [Companilactobacillus mishanensis]MQS88845.1 PspC domain-containing protein [Companilactobacillus mishanensis]